MKWQLIIHLGIVLLMISLVNAIGEYPLCPDKIDIITAPCQMVTVPLNCSVYTYDVFNSTNETIVDQGSLEPFRNNQYYFNVTYPPGTYVADACNGLITRQFQIVEDVNRMELLAVIILIPFIMSGLMFWISGKIREDLWALTFGFIVFGFMLIMIGLGLTMQIVAKYINFPSLNDTLGSFLQGYTWFLWVIGIFLSFYVVMVIFTLVQSNNKKRTGGYDEG